MNKTLFAFFFLFFIFVALFFLFVVFFFQLKIKLSSLNFHQNKKARKIWFFTSSSCLLSFFFVLISLFFFWSLFPFLILFSGMISSYLFFDLEKERKRKRVEKEKEEEKTTFQTRNVRFFSKMFSTLATNVRFFLKCSPLQPQILHILMKEGMDGFRVLVWGSVLLSQKDWE